MELPPEIYTEICKYLQRPKFVFKTNNEYFGHTVVINCHLAYVGIFGESTNQYFNIRYNHLKDSLLEIIRELDNNIESLKNNKGFTFNPCHNFSIQFGDENIEIISCYEHNKSKIKYPRDMFQSDFLKLFDEIKNNYFNINDHYNSMSKSQRLALY